MNWFVRGLLVPTDNRHYIGSRLHFIMFIVSYVPLIVVITIFALSQDSWLVGVGLLAAMTVFALLDYFVFDSIRDKLLWKYFFKKYYDYKGVLPAGHHDAIKNYERHPTEDNKRKLERNLKEQ